MEQELKEIKEIALKNEQALIEHNCKIEQNNKKIMANFDKIQQNSFALEIVKDYKADSKKWFTILLIVLCMWLLTIGYLVYVLNDTGTSEETLEIQDVETIDNSHIKIGDDIWEKSN